jgi:hypothetical protein
MLVLHHGISRKVQDCQGQGIENLSPLFVESVYHEAQDGASDLVLGDGHGPTVLQAEGSLQAGLET